MAKKKDVQTLPLNVETDTEPTSSITYANEVIAIIAGLAASEVEGIAGMVNVNSGLKGKNRNVTRGVKVEVGTEEVSVDLYLNVEYGTPIQRAAHNAQESVKKSIESMTGLHVVRVDVHVMGVSFEKENNALQAGAGKAVLEAGENRILTEKQEKEIRTESDEEAADEDAVKPEEEEHPEEGEAVEDEPMTDEEPDEDNPADETDYASEAYEEDVKEDFEENEAPAEEDIAAAFSESETILPDTAQEETGESEEIPAEESETDSPEADQSEKA